MEKLEINIILEVEKKYQILEIVKMICSHLDIILPMKKKKYSSFIKFVDDRLGHDFRYSVNFLKLKTNELET